MRETKICCICDEAFAGYGNDPWPIADDGECCDLCNASKVIPARLRRMKEDNNEE